MGKALFYHLTDQPLEATAPTLLRKSLEAGWHVAVRGTSPDRLSWLDEKLWLQGDGSFLPHGQAGGPHDADQPILLTQGPAHNAARCLMSIDGAEATAEDVEQFERVWILFDGMDEAAVSHARVQWKTLTGAGCSAEYWGQEGSRWVKKAES